MKESKQIRGQRTMREQGNVNVMLVRPEEAQLARG